MVHGQKIFCSSWRSRPQEHGSTYHGEACTIKLFHVLIFDLINFAKIGLWNHMGPKGILGCSFVPKISKMGQGMAELCFFPTERLSDFIENKWNQRGSLGVHLCKKDLKSVKKWLSYAIFQLRGCVI